MSRMEASISRLITAGHFDWGLPHEGPPPAPGADEKQLGLARATFNTLGFPLNDELLSVYRRTLGVPGIVNDLPMLCTPCTVEWEGAPYASYLINQFDRACDEDVLWLGYSNTSSLIMDRDGAFDTTARRTNSSTVHLGRQRSFAEVFPEFVEALIAELEREFECKLPG